MGIIEKMYHMRFNCKIKQRLDCKRNEDNHFVMLGGILAHSIWSLLAQQTG